MLLIDPEKRDESSSVVSKLRELSNLARESSKTERVSSEPSKYQAPFKEIGNTTEPTTWETRLESLELDPNRKQAIGLPSEGLIGANHPQIRPRGDTAVEVTTVDEWIQETVDLKKYQRVTVRRTQRKAFPSLPTTANPALQLGDTKLQAEYSALSSEELADTETKLLTRLAALQEVQRVRNGPRIEPEEVE